MAPSVATAGLQAGFAKKAKEEAIKKAPAALQTMVGCLPLDGQVSFLKVRAPFGGARASRERPRASSRDVSRSSSAPAPRPGSHRLSAACS